MIACTIPVSIHILPTFSEEGTDCFHRTIIKDFGHEALHSGKGTISGHVEACGEGAVTP